MSIFSILLYVALGLLGIAYLTIKRKLSYFKNKGIAQLDTELFFGNARDMVRKKTYMAELFTGFYKKFKAMGVKHGGIYIMLNKTWVPIDPKLIKDILVKDFNYFNAHFINLPDRVFFQTLFHMYGDVWKDMRRKLTPTFTSGKMKMMFDILYNKTNGLMDMVGKMCETGEAAEIKAILARYTTDVIGNCGFGIECNSMEDENSEFFEYGQAVFGTQRSPPLYRLVLMFLGLIPARINPDVTPMENFFRKVVKETVTYREENKIIRKDFLHLMIQLKNKGIVTELTNDNDDIFHKTVTKEVMSIDEITSQCLLFFIAGFETSSTTMSYALLELAHNQDIQKKLREEVREVLKRHNGKLSYDALQEMTYCDNVINETLRMYPPVSVLPRVCTKNYTIPGTDIVIEEGTNVMIPIMALQKDPQHFPEPDKFTPERFSAENKGNIKEFTFIPFGEGPRMCLGLRFGVMQSKAGIASLVNNYNFTLNKRTPYPPTFKKGFIAPILTTETGIWLNATKVN